MSLYPANPLCVLPLSHTRPTRAEVFNETFPKQLQIHLLTLEHQQKMTRCLFQTIHFSPLLLHVPLKTGTRLLLTEVSQSRRYSTAPIGRSMASHCRRAALRTADALHPGFSELEQCGSPMIVVNAATRVNPHSLVQIAAGGKCCYTGMYQGYV